jgi:hypothetical protein
MGSSTRRRIRRRSAWYEACRDADVAFRCDGLLVLDVDPPSGEESLARLERDHGPLPATREQRTPRGGRHLLFRLPEGVEVGNSTRGLGSPAGLDVRAGDRGYIVVSPSVNGDSGYRWTSNAPIADAPGWLVTALVKPPPTEPQAAPPVARKDPHSRYGLAALDGERAAVEVSPEGQRNTRLNEAAFALGQLEAGGELVPGDAEDVLVAAATRAGLPEAEARRTARSGLVAGRTSPRSAPTGHRPLSSSKGSPASGSDAPTERYEPPLSLVPLPAFASAVEESAEALIGTSDEGGPGKPLPQPPLPGLVGPKTVRVRPAGAGVSPDWSTTRSLRRSCAPPSPGT